MERVIYNFRATDRHDEYGVYAVEVAPRFLPDADFRVPAFSVAEAIETYLLADSHGLVSRHFEEI
jgi:hypothetical protein